MLGAYCEACFFGNKTEVWRGCGLPTVTEKGWTRLGCIFTFLRWSTFILICVISFCWKKSYFPTLGVGVRSTCPTLPPCLLTYDVCHRPVTQNSSHQRLVPNFPACRHLGYLLLMLLLWLIYPVSVHRFPFVSHRIGQRWWVGVDWSGRKW